MPPLPKTCPKTVSAPNKGVAFLAEHVFAKKFLVPGEDPAFDASASVEQRRQVNRKLAPPTDVYLLKLEAAVRAAKKRRPPLEADWINSTRSRSGNDETRCAGLSARRRLRISC